MAATDQHVPGGQENQRHRCRVLERQRVRYGNYVDRRHRDELRIATIDSVAQNCKRPAKALMSRSALRALIAEDHRHEQHALSSLEVAHIFADLRNFAGNVAAIDMWQLYAR